jgi:CRP-like cAMP-binding protein
VAERPLVLPPEDREHAVPNDIPNTFFSNLSAQTVEALTPHLRTVELEQGTCLFETGDNIESIAFPHSGTLVSFIVSLSEGQNIEAGMVGQTGIVGSSALVNGYRALSTALVQLPGRMSVARREPVMEIVARDPAFRSRIASHEQFMYVQAQQAAACNISHDIQSRLCRWLLHARDLGGGDTLHFTQEFLAQILGVSRTTVTLVARQLQAAGLIKYRRGVIRLVNDEGLEEGACECRNVIKTHHERLLVGGWNEP